MNTIICRKPKADETDCMEVGVPVVPSDMELWEIIAEQRRMLSHYYTVAKELRLWAHFNKVEVPEFAKFDQEMEMRYGLLQHRTRTAKDGMTFKKTGGVSVAFYSRDLAPRKEMESAQISP